MFVPTQRTNRIKTSAPTPPIKKGIAIPLPNDNKDTQKPTTRRGRADMRAKMTNFEVRFGYPGTLVFAPQNGHPARRPAFFLAICKFRPQPALPLT